MRIQKRMIPRLFFLGEIAVFAWLYFLGSQGICAVRAMKYENEKLEQSVLHEHADIGHLEKDIVVWQENNFVKEKLAREQLQMAREDEEVYLL